MATLRNPGCTSPFLAPATRRQRSRAAFVAAGVLGLFGSLYVAQRLGFDFGLLFWPCGFKQRYGLPCPTCGMTTAVLAFARGQIVLAFSIQPAAGLLCSALVVAAAASLVIAISGIIPGFVEGTLARVRMLHVLIALGLLLAAGWAVTFLRAVMS